MTITETPTVPTRAEVALPAPKSQGISRSIVIALVVAALGIGFATGRLLATSAQAWTGDYEVADGAGAEEQAGDR